MKILCFFIAAILIICTPNISQAGVFGEAALSVGGNFPQGSFSRYADAGFMINGRGTLHIPTIEMFVLWADFGFTGFKSETVETRRILYEIENGPTVYRAVNQTTSEDMVTGHIGLQLASMTKRAFFRPRAALGIGFYAFSNEIGWTEQDADTTVVLATQSLDHQTCFGWRAVIGIDFFFTTQIGATADLVYDHVFNLNQTESPDFDTRRTSRFNGFTIGIVYMFKSK